MARDKVTRSGLPPSFPSQSTSAEYQMTEKNLLQWKQRVPLVEIRDKAGAAAQLFYVCKSPQRGAAMCTQTQQLPLHKTNN